VPTARATRVDPLREIQTADRERLIGIVAEQRANAHEWIRRQVIENRRVDVLARFLGYQVKPLHFAIARHQMAHKHSLTLAFRGCGKSTIGTVTKAIHYLLVNSDARIILASKTLAQARDFVRLIRAHFEADEFQEVFGNLVGDRWETEAITVKRVARLKEPSVMAIGAEGALVSKHFDVGLFDDLVDEKNARTKYSRDLLYTWYYKVLLPCMEPHAHTHRLGTRYHPGDLWGHHEASELKNATLLIRALDDRGRSPWATKFPTTWLEEQKRQLGTLIFNSQYQCDTVAMQGEVFELDWMTPLGHDERVPAAAKTFMGVDLAIRESDKHDEFAIVVIAVEGSRIFVVDHYKGHLSFKQQTARIRQYADRYNPERIAIETNAYQLAQYQTVVEQDPSLRLQKVWTHKDKFTRATRLAAYFEDGRVIFTPGNQPVIDQLVMFPGGDKKDLFDALDLAVTAAIKRKRKRREVEPGLL